MAGNALVAAPVDLTTPFSGTFLLEDGEALCTAISSGDWVAGGMAAFSLALDGISMALDPIGSLIAMGLGWLMDHIEPLKGWLNDLTGDAGEVAGFAGTWQNIAAHLQQAGVSLEDSLRGLAGMQGQAADAFRAFHTDAARHLAASGEWAGAIGTGMTIASTIVKMVHDMTRDAISTVVGTAASAALTTVVTVGFGAPVAVAQVASKVASLAAKLTKFITNLLKSVKQLIGLVEELVKLFRKLMGAVQDALRNLPTRAPDAPTTRPPGSHGGLPPTRPDDGLPPVVHSDPDAPRPGDGHVEPGRPPSDPWPEDPPQPRPVDQQYVDQDILDDFDPRTDPDGATLWSGRVVVDGEVIPDATQLGAQRLTQSTHGSTLEQMLDAQGLTDRMPTDWLDRRTSETWAAVSSELARNATGDVRAYLGDVRPTSVWNQYELPTLLNNPNVTSITIIDAYTGRIVQVIER